VPGMAAQRRGWPHRARGDGGDALHWYDITASSCAGVGEVSISFSRALPSSFEGAARRSYGSRRHSVTELTLASPHSVVQWRGWSHKAGGRRNSAGVGFPSGVRGPVWRGFALDPGVRGVPAFNALVGGVGAASRARGGGPTLASSEAEFRPRGRPAL
jgi:hypothetical protein